MVYLREFENHAAYEAAKNSLELPNVSICDQEEEAHYNPYVHDYSQNYLTFVALESGTFKLSGNSINYSLDNGETWTELASNTDSPSVNAGDKILWKATLTPSSSSPYGIGKFSSTGNYNVEGNPMSLLFGDNFVGQTSLEGKNNAFQNMFSGSTKLVSAENLSLLATTLANYCYYGMFNGCSSLTTAPVLSATTLANYCYYGMFEGCTSLTTAPVLPATTLTKSCYENMFSDCTSLTTAPELPATTLATYCYEDMFYYCSGLTTAPELPATTLAKACYDGMFCGCIGLTTAPELPATTLADLCYDSMFRDCRSLTTAPVLSATTLPTKCYNYMFYDCSSLNSITCLATDISATDCTRNWIVGVAPNGTFTKAASMTSWTIDVFSGIPSNWTVVDAS